MHLYRRQGLSRNKPFNLLLCLSLESFVTNQPWYEQGYRANIVTYSISLFHFLLKKHAPDKTFDLSCIWNKQTVPSSVLNEFKKITAFVNECITDPERETVNVTQWCKRENCWKKIKQASEQEDLLLDIDNIDSYLLSVDDDKCEMRQAKSSQRVVSDVEAQTIILNQGAAFWIQLEEFILAKHLGSPEMRKALWPAKRMPAKIPTPYQSKRLLELWEEAKAEGFKPTVREDGETY